WIPTQDSPGIRQTWAATVTVPEGFVPVMSAQMMDGATGTPAPQGRRSFRFKMDNPVPPYLIAIAVGDLKFKEVGPRAGVWAEAGMLDAAVDEFADVEKMIDAAQGAVWPLSLGPLRHARAAAVLSLWRDGEPQSHLPHADDHHRRQVEHRCAGA
ncbi:MAG: hypothetical protein ACK4GG_13920, partial [Sphingomonas sp.]